jgi:hypothetical protein
VALYVGADKRMITVTILLYRMYHKYGATGKLGYLAEYGKM